MDTIKCSVVEPQALVKDEIVPDTGTKLSSENAKAAKLPGTGQENSEGEEGEELEEESLSDEESEDEHSGKLKVGRRKRNRYSTFTRKLWNDEEDDAILNLVKTYGVRRWTLISKKLQEGYHIHGRSGKQCRERYR